MYADGITLFSNIKTIPGELRNVAFNKELETISHLLACNKLSLHVSRTKHIIFHISVMLICYIS